jgi:CheY-like chemotaxis protein
MDQKASVNILIVDDNDAIRMLLSEILKAGGYDVSLACHGQEALEMIQKMELISELDPLPAIAQLHSSRWSL